VGSSEVFEGGRQGRSFRVAALAWREAMRILLMGKTGTGGETYSQGRKRDSDSIAC